MELNTIQSSYLKKSITAKARIVPAGTIAISQRRESWEIKPGTHKSRQGRHRLAHGVSRGESNPIRTNSPGRGDIEKNDGTENEYDRDYEGRPTAHAVG